MGVARDAAIGEERGGVLREARDEADGLDADVLAGGEPGPRQDRSGVAPLERVDHVVELVDGDQAPAEPPDWRMQP